MITAEIQAVYVMWLRQMKRFIRSKSRIVASIFQPLFFLVILGSGLRNAVMPTIIEGDYLSFIAPGIIGMSILFSSMFTGVSILWDRQFGFLQEVLVAPISRFSIILGRTLGGATVAMIQGLIILTIAIVLGVKVQGPIEIIFTLIIMVTLSFSAVGFGLVVASRMRDFQGFQIIMNLIMMPLLFASSAFFPIVTNEEMPLLIRQASLFNPLFYIVDGIRGSLTGSNYYFPPVYDFLVVLVICIVMMGLGSYFFSRSEV